MLLNTHIQLADGVRVRIRLPHSSDRPGLESLYARTTLDGGEIDAARLLRFDPRRETVVCATTWVGLVELLVGYGVIEHDAGAPHVLVCDDENAPGLHGALHDAMTRATTHLRAA